MTEKDKYFIGREEQPYSLGDEVVLGEKEGTLIGLSGDGER